MLISVSGLDGAGKTTAIAALRQELESHGRPTTVMHLNDRVGLYAWIGALRDRVTGTQRPGVDSPPRTEPRTSALGRFRDAILWSKALRRLLLPIDIACFAAIRFYVERIRGRTLITDRYFYDRLVDVAPQSRADRGWRWVRTLARLTPAPDVAILLDITPEQAFARKGEYSVPYLAQRAAAYERVFAWAPAAVRIPSSTKPQVQRAIGDAVKRRAESTNTQLRAAGLRVLLEPVSVDADDIDWAELRPVAERGAIIVRVADALVRRGETLPPKFAEAAARACARTHRMLEVVDRISERCNALGIRHAFLKTAEMYPDSGRDLDLLIADTSPAVDRQILQDMPATFKSPSLRNRLAGSRTHTAAYGIVVDVHHGRLGRFGEQARYARLLLDRAAAAQVGHSTFPAPAPADHFLLLATQQVYTRPALRLADVCSAVALLRHPGAVSWDYVFATALSIGMVSAVGAYLAYVDRLHTRLFDRPLVDDTLLARFQVADRTALGRGQDARYPRSTLARRLYLQHIQATVEAGRWVSAARLSLAPLVTALPRLKGARA